MLRSSLQTSSRHQELVDMLRLSLQTSGRHQELVERLRHIHDNGPFPTYVEMFYLRSLTKRLPDLTISVTRRVLIRHRNRLSFANTWIPPRFCWLGACWSSYQFPALCFFAFVLVLCLVPNQFCVSRFVHCSLFLRCSLTFISCFTKVTSGI